MDESVALYDDAGRPSGSAPRSQVRARNLHHAATAVVVRDPLGRVYVHRRTDTKDVYPGLHDFTAGGIVLADEHPDDAAVRELAEELGVTDVALEPVTVRRFTDDHTDYLGHCYVTTYDGPISWQPEEVAWGCWVSLDRLLEMLDSAEWGFVPDSSALLGWWLRERAADRVPVTQGWDNHTELVEGRWIDRRPRRPETVQQLRTEARLMGALAPHLPLRVPVPVVLDEEPLRVRHPLVPGRPATGAELTESAGAQLGAFLRSLHASDPEAAHRVGVPGPEAAQRQVAEDVAGFTRQVLPLLPADRVHAGEELLRDAEEAATTAPVLVHGDLGPEHVLTVDGRTLSGVIDWGDVRLMDPAVDLAWTLNGTPREFAAALAQEYGVTEELRRRGLVWHRLGPWHEVLWGLGDGGSQHVESGLAGVLGRL